MKIGVIGGTGVNKMKGVLFIPRHGHHHEKNPTEVNYKTNLLKIRSAEIKRVIGINTVGSLQDNIKPGTIVIPDQFIDFTKKRDYDLGGTFHNGSVCHLSMAEPMCPEMRSRLIDCAIRLRLPYKDGGTYVCIEGPRFSTKAESKMFRMLGGDIIGMTLVPECILAKELEMCYASICIVTDYDTFKEDKTVTIKEIKKIMKQSEKNVNKLIELFVKTCPEKRSCNCKYALDGALI